MNLTKASSTLLVLLLGTHAGTVTDAAGGPCVWYVLCRRYRYSISISIFFFFLLTLIIITSFSLSLSVFVSLSLVFSSLGRGENATSTSGSADSGSAMPPMSFFSDQNYTETYGSWCAEWLNPEGKLGICNDGKDCTEPWCYVAADADCDPSMTYPTRFFADTEFASSLKFSNDPCVDDDSSSEDDSSSSSASTFLTSTIVMSLVGLMMM